MAGSGGECRIAYPGIESAPVRDSSGNRVKTFSDRAGRIRFASIKGEKYAIGLE